MPVPVYVGHGATFPFATSTTPNAPKPTVPGTAVVDDVMLLIIAVPAGPTLTPPTGWTEIATTGYVNGAACFYYLRVATEDDTGVTTYTGSLSSSALWAAGIVAYRNIDTIDPIQGTPTTATTAAGTTINITGHTSDENHQMVVVWAQSDGGGVWTPPSGFTEKRDTTGIELSELFLATSGTSTGTITATASAARDLYGTAFILRPKKYQPNTYYRRHS